jgi:hypothetical protein
MAFFRKNFHYREKHVFLRLYKQYVRPHLEFAVPAWSQWLKGDIETLEKVQEKAVISQDRDPHEIKVVFDHTRIAPYWRLRVGNVGERVRLLAVEGDECCAAGVFPSNPILSGRAEQRLCT